VSEDTLLIRERLRSGENLEALVAQYHLHARRHKDFPNLVLLKYDQIESPMAEPLVQQCRGLILDEADDWRVITRPFDKFFNAGEQLAAPIHWPSARVLEKVDGSLMQLYEYRGGWHVASSGSPDASGAVGGHDITFASLFWDVFEAQDMALPRDTRLTYLFELTAPENRVVCGYNGRKLTFLGARSRNYPYFERSARYVVATEKPHGWVPVKDFNLAPAPETEPGVISGCFGGDEPPMLSLNDVEKGLEAINPLEQEGYVVVDLDFRRIKVKHPGYVLAHQLRGSWSPRAALEAVRKGELPELAAHFPEMKEQLAGIQLALDGLRHQLETDYERLKDLQPQKAFALEAVQCPLQGAPLFCLRNGKTPSVSAFLAEMNLDRLAAELMLSTDPKKPDGSIYDA
jgi:hypothetical protein